MVQILAWKLTQSYIKEVCYLWKSELANAGPVMPGDDSSIYLIIQ